jgi:hypothetical protein
MYSSFFQLIPRMRQERILRNFARLSPSKVKHPRGCLLRHSKQQQQQGEALNSGTWSAVIKVRRRNLDHATWNKEQIINDQKEKILDLNYIVWYSIDKYVVSQTKDRFDVF